MKHISTILGIVAIVLATGLYFAQSREIAQLKKHTGAEVKPTGNNGFKIAYFDMDSLQSHYDHFKDAQALVKSKEDEMNSELARLDRDNQKKIEQWRQKGNTMTQAEGEAAQQEYQQMQQAFAGRKQDLEQRLYKNTEDLKTSIRKEIEEYLKDYNKQKNFSYIFAYDAGSFIYNKDSSLNITGELVEGLNASYKKKP
jgi:outer membrane protein